MVLRNKKKIAITKSCNFKVSGVSQTRFQLKSEADANFD